MSSPVIIPINTSSLKDYQKFLKAKKLPRYEVVGNEIITDQESYNMVFSPQSLPELSIQDSCLFDYQEWVVNMALKIKKYAAFLDCGLGKTVIILKWAEAICKKHGKVLIQCPLSVIPEFKTDFEKFGITVPLVDLRKGEEWTEGVGIINYEGCYDIDMEGVYGFSLDESSILKNGDGKTKKYLVELAKGIPYRLACSATPSPNEQAEYASHAVFLGYCNTNKEFYSRFFRKDGTKWILKDHAVDRFYEYLKSFCCYIQNPKLLGFETGGYLDDDPQYIEKSFVGGSEFLNGKMFATKTSMSDAGKIYKYRSDTTTDRFKWCVEQAKKYKSIVWCYRNAEEQAFKKAIPNSVLITGATPIQKRNEYINSFRRGEIRCIISKAKILGFGINLQQAEAHIVSGYTFSFEQFYQMIRRSHRYGREGVLKVFIPMIEAEVPIWETLERKMKTFNKDVRELQRRFF